MAYFFSKNFWLDLLFPVRCLDCGRESTSGRKRSSSSSHGQKNNPSRGQEKSPQEKFLCSSCRLNLKFSAQDFNLKIKNIDEIFIAGDYENLLLADLIKKLKFNSLSALGEILAEFISLFWQGRAIIQSEGIFSLSKSLPASKSSPDFKNILVIPIPLSRRRERARGFNQAEIIARKFAENFSYPLSCRLIKQHQTKAQSSLSAHKRMNNLSGAFAWTGESLQNKNIILIDDVITTGATMQEAASILKQAGAEKIIALAVAKG